MPPLQPLALWFNHELELRQLALGQLLSMAAKKPAKSEMLKHSWTLAACKEKKAYSSRGCKTAFTVSSETYSTLTPLQEHSTILQHILAKGQIWFFRKQLHTDRSFAANR